MCDSKTPNPVPRYPMDVTHPTKTQITGPCEKPENPALPTTQKIFPPLARAVKII